ncbi:MAG: lipid-A-disaccharide synthase N-terminal domain-containing protein [Micavibrio aeruginosavorus]|uniref:Lipid-A-disaccharide synthase N-terminal domain-containing protein n=1 Tax=Micavibrio aeruginosavorus TaxID=349221 RepID=A0A7T5R4E6_9BACT|nr:MAG: lipid-A-disaccharide synthase N-terminal domain-containing protein [Micavibrio aeruginosavorus]
MLSIPAFSAETIWLIVGFIGQALFFGRFLVQWLASEKAKRSVIPHAFWYFSIGGGLTLFVYALYRQDPVFILGQSTGLLIYARNLYFIRRNSKPVSTQEFPVSR